MGRGVIPIRGPSVARCKLSNAQSPPGSLISGTSLQTLQYIWSPTTPAVTTELTLVAQRRIRQSLASDPPPQRTTDRQTRNTSTPHPNHSPYITDTLDLVELSIAENPAQWARRRGMSVMELQCLRLFSGADSKAVLQDNGRLPPPVIKMHPHLRHPP